MHKTLFTAVVILSAACSSPPVATPRHGGGDASHSQAADRVMLTIPAGQFVTGSTPEERAQAYDDYRGTAGHDAARDNNWFERERDRTTATLPAYRIDQTPVTQVAFAEFVRDTKLAPPTIDEATWKKQGFVQDYTTQVTRYNWTTDAPPSGREDHPMVLATWQEAKDYCAWRGTVIGEPRRLPTADEFEKAARGATGRIYPWGNQFDASKLNSQIEGPLDTTPVGTFAEGASPYGMLDAAGNIFHWTSTLWPHRQGTITVKGSAWDDYAGVGRGAAMHGRRTWVRHVLVGFRCAADAPPSPQ